MVDNLDKSIKSTVTSMDSSFSEAVNIHKVFHHVLSIHYIINIYFQDVINNHLVEVANNITEQTKMTEKSVIKTTNAILNGRKNNSEHMEFFTANGITPDHDEFTEPPLKVKINYFQNI